MSVFFLELSCFIVLLESIIYICDTVFYSRTVKKFMSCFEGPPVSDYRTPVNQTDEGGALHDGKRWYIAIVQTNCERKVLLNLKKIGVEAFIPVQRVGKMYQGKRREVEQVVIRSRVFIRICPDSSSRTAIKQTMYVKKFVCYPGTYQDAPIPDEQIDLFRYMLGTSDDKVVLTDNVKLGSRARIIRGVLCGLEGNICEVGTQKHICVGVRMDILGFACVKVELADLEILE